jgi:hypothetical protein
MKKLVECLLAVILPIVMYGEIVWTTPPNILSTPGQNATNPQVGVDTSGNLVATWLEGGSLYSKFQPYGSTWSIPADLLTNKGASSPQLMVDENGNATAIWVESGVVKAASKLWGGVWSAPATLSALGAVTPQAGVDSSGNVVVVWERGGVIESSTQLFKGGWSLIPDVLSAIGATSPQLSVGSNGAVVCVWSAAGAAANAIYTSNKTVSGGLWTASQSISNPSINSVYPVVVVDANGNATAAWFTYIPNGSFYGNVVVETASQPTGGSWTSPIDITADPHTGIINPDLLFLRLTCDGMGNVIALWNNSQDGSNFMIHANILPVGQSWIGAADLILNNAYALGGNVTADSVSYALAAYMAYNSPSGNLEIHAMATNLNALKFINYWGDLQTISIGNLNGYPTIAGTIVGGTTHYLGALWINNNGSNTTIQAVTGTGNVLLPPSNLMISQNTTDLGFYTDHSNTLTWTLSPSPEATGYVIARNGLFIAQVDATTLQYSDYNRDPMANDSYTIATIDVNNNQSSTVQITLYHDTKPY